MEAVGAPFHRGGAYPRDLRGVLRDAVAMSALWTASWQPRWYNLDQTLLVGRPSAFAFSLPGPAAGPERELTFAYRPESTHWRATVVSIENARFGPVREVITTSFGEYTFRFEDGRWAVIEAEEWLCALNSASPDFPVEEYEEGWGQMGGWDMRVTLTDVEGPVSCEVARAIMRGVADEVGERDAQRPGE